MLVRVTQFVPRARVGFAPLPPHGIVIPVRVRRLPSENGISPAPRVRLHVQPVDDRIVCRALLDKAVRLDRGKRIAEADRVTIGIIDPGPGIVPPLLQLTALHVDLEHAVRETLRPQRLARHAEALEFVRGNVRMEAQRELEVGFAAERRLVVVPRSPYDDIRDRLGHCTPEVIRQNERFRGPHVHALLGQVRALNPLGFAW